MKEKIQSVLNFVVFVLIAVFLFFNIEINKNTDNNSYKYEFVKMSHNSEKSLKKDFYEENLKNNTFVVFKDIKDSSDVYFKFEPLYSEVSPNERLYCHLVDDFQNNVYLGSVINKDISRNNIFVRLPQRNGNYQLKIYSKDKFNERLIDQITFKVESKFGLLDDILRTFM